MNGCQDSIPYASSCNLKMSKAETFRGGILQFGPHQLHVHIKLSVIWQCHKVCNLKMSEIVDTPRPPRRVALSYHSSVTYTTYANNCSFISYCLWLTINFCSTEIVLASTFLILVILMFLAWVSIYSEDGDGESRHLSFTFRLFFSSIQTFWHSLQNNENKHCWKITPG